MGLLPQEIIRTKRDGGALAADDIRAFIAGVTDGRVTEGQVAAFCMAVLWRGMTLGERVALTASMAASGRRLDWGAADLGGPVLDKHSTGGVGDKVSLVLAPLVAACGGFVPMLSGRGLGHSGGTLDKLDSIPGYVSRPGTALLERALRQAGCAVIGATADLAPADQRIYAIRDVTATVESIDLITASILSKKLAAGPAALVMDVKFGSGAFAGPLAGARALAESIVTVANGAGLPTRALLTDMNQVLGTTAGNAVEVAEACDMLTGRSRDARLWAVTLALSVEMLLLGGLAADAAEAEAKLTRALDSGAAAERFGRMVAALGGPADFMDRYAALLPQAPVRLAVAPPRPGFVTAIDVRALGLAIVALGGGRTRPQDGIDPAVGFTDIIGIGERIEPERPLLTVHAASGEAAAEAARRVQAACRIADEAPPPAPLIAGRIG